MQCSRKVQSLFSVNEYDKESKKGMSRNGPSENETREFSSDGPSRVKQGIGVWMLILSN
jgi:hypothetical protein